MQTEAISLSDGIVSGGKILEDTIFKNENFIGRDGVFVAGSKAIEVKVFENEAECSLFIIRDSFVHLIPKKAGNIGRNWLRHKHTK
ncbi:MAG: hypothetical protein QXN59_02645 [Candidatus Micrarchaeaceae archaeon]